MAQAYGPAITLQQAKTVAAAALAEAQKCGWQMAIAIVDPSGHLVCFDKMDDTQTGSILVCQEKAQSSALFKRPTMAFQEMLAAGGDGLRVLRIKGAIPVAGGVPVVIDDRIAGAIGVSGGTSAQDDQCAVAGACAVADGSR